MQDSFASHEGTAVTGVWGTTGGRAASPEAVARAHAAQAAALRRDLELVERQRHAERTRMEEAEEALAAARREAGGEGEPSGAEGATEVPRHVSSPSLDGVPDALAAQQAEIQRLESERQQMAAWLKRGVYEARRTTEAATRLRDRCASAEASIGELQRDRDAAAAAEAQLSAQLSEAAGQLNRLRGEAGTAVDAAWLASKVQAEQSTAKEDVAGRAAQLRHRRDLLGPAVGRLELAAGMVGVLADVLRQADTQTTAVGEAAVSGGVSGGAAAPAPAVLAPRDALTTADTSVLPTAQASAKQSLVVSRQPSASREPSPGGSSAAAGKPGRRDDDASPADVAGEARAAAARVEASLSALRVALRQATVATDEERAAFMQDSAGDAAADEAMILEEAAIAAEHMAAAKARLVRAKQTMQSAGYWKAAAASAAETAAAAAAAEGSYGSPAAQVSATTRSGTGITGPSAPSLSAPGTSTNRASGSNAGFGAAGGRSPAPPDLFLQAPPGAQRGTAVDASMSPLSTPLSAAASPSPERLPSGVSPDARPGLAVTVLTPGQHEFLAVAAATASAPGFVADEARRFAAQAAECRSRVERLEQRRERRRCDFEAVEEMKARYRDMTMERAELFREVKAMERENDELKAEMQGIPPEWVGGGPARQQKAASAAAVAGPRPPWRSVVLS